MGEPTQARIGSNNFLVETDLRIPFFEGTVPLTLTGFLCAAG